MNAVVDTKSSEPEPDPAPLPMDASSALSNDAPIDPPQSEEVVVAASDQPSAEACCWASIHRPLARTTEVSICLAGIDQ